MAVTRGRSEERITDTDEVRVAKKSVASREFVLAERRLIGTDEEIVQQLDELIASLLALRKWLSSPETMLTARDPGVHDRSSRGRDR
jgi:hypothetical protein